MKTHIFFAVLFIYLNTKLSGQEIITDSSNYFNINEVVVTATKLPIPLKNNPGSVTIVTPEILNSIPKSIAAEEALRLVPGVRIDNQHNGERIHLSIRGQGILTERGLRGIGVIVDGIPLNDPSGFVPDLYDIDWTTVNTIEVLRGPAAGLYGGSNAGGVVNINTANGCKKIIGGELIQSLGTNGFRKSLAQIDGSQQQVDYRLTFSRTDGNGYRDHQAFWGNKLYEKINFRPSSKINITQVLLHTDYFHQNPEGLNLGQFDNLKQANPDANPFNEYQKTKRTTLGFNGNFAFSKLHDAEVTAYLRSWNYKETSNKSAEYRNINNPGATFQYNLHLISERLSNHVSIGIDYKYQQINMYKLQSAANPQRVESVDETNIETDSILANQIISQHNTGFFALYRLETGKFNLMASLRHDIISNELTDKLTGINQEHISKNFSELSMRIGASYNLFDPLTLFANWSKGFIPPSTEELASNPEGYAGFNTHLVPAVSDCYEFGVRGFRNPKLYYEITGFALNTDNDFFRFKQSGRGNQEVFYGNAGNSKRYGIETFVSYKLLENLELAVAYTYSQFKYTSASVDPVYTDTAYVLTTPPASGQWLPNSPRHQLFAEADYSLGKNFKVNFSTELQSKWAIYTDAKAYGGELDPLIYKNWQDGFNLYHIRFSYLWKLNGLMGECSISVRNLTGETYMAFTEPDPDGNSYQPGPGREWFGNVKLRF